MVGASWELMPGVLAGSLRNVSANGTFGCTGSAVPGVYVLFMVGTTQRLLAALHTSLIIILVVSLISNFRLSCTLLPI